MTRPVLPRASSATSGFFFCGMIDEPVQKRSASAHEAEARVHPQDELLGEARHVHHRRARRRRRIRSRNRDRTRRRANWRTAPSKPSSRATRSRSIGIARARERRAAQRQPVDAPAAVGEALRVAREHRLVGEQMVAERDGLRDLQVRVAGHDRVGVAFGEIDERAAQRCESRDERVDRVAQPQPQVGGDLVVARARRCADACRRRRRAPSAASRC